MDNSPTPCPLPKGARTHCRECESGDIKAVILPGVPKNDHNVKCTCQSCGHFWYVNGGEPSK